MAPFSFFFFDFFALDVGGCGEAMVAPRQGACSSRENQKRLLPSDNIAAHLDWGRLRCSHHALLQLFYDRSGVARHCEAEVLVLEDRDGADIHCKEAALDAAGLERAQKVTSGYLHAYFPRVWRGRAATPT